MDKKVIEFISQNDLIRKHSKVLVAVSGGPDSLALLHFLYVHQDSLCITLTVVSVDHQLRGETSAADAKYVQKVCEFWQIPCTLAAVDVPAYKEKHNVGTQIAARECRYHAFRELMETESIDYLAFGHHADDQIETLLMAFMRTTHVHNFTGMPVKRPFASGEIIRPFLSVSKEEIHTYIEENDLTPRIDASNFSEDYTRNRIRSNIVPLLKQENPNLAVTVRKLTERIQEDESFILSAAKQALKHSTTIDEKDKIVKVQIDLLQLYAVSLQRKVFRLVLDYLYQTMPEQLSYRHEEMLFDLVNVVNNRRLDFPGGLVVERAYDYLYFYFPVQESIVDKRYSIDSIPGKIYLPNGMIFSCYSITADQFEAEKNDSHTYIFSRDSVQLPIIIRYREAGDRITYDGLNGTKKLNKVFIDEKIPRHKRASWPVVTDVNGEVLWLPGLRKNSTSLALGAPYACIELKNQKNR